MDQVLQKLKGLGRRCPRVGAMGIIFQILGVEKWMLRKQFILFLYNSEVLF